MAVPDPAAASAVQAHLFAFAIAELVRQHRGSFQPLWSAESWAKLLIWLALNCGCSGDEAGLRAFAAALGPRHSVRLRRLFFQRELEDLGLQVMADPAEPQVLVLPLEAAALEGDGALPLERAERALDRCDLLPLLVAERGLWQSLEAAVAVPWAAASAASASSAAARGDG